MYDNYSFVLEFRELPEELINEKIDIWLEKQYDEEIDPQDEIDEYLTRDEYIQNEYNRRDAERSIQARFPMYF